MNFGQIASALNKKRVFSGTFDFGGEIGEQPINFVKLSYEQRQDILVARASADGTGIDVRKADGALYLNAEFVALSLCDEKGKSVIELAAVKRWEPDIVDRLAAFITNNLPKPPGADAEDPSAATS